MSKETGSITIRFAGDSGDGIQLLGNRFTVESASAGSDYATYPSFPAEIRAPAGSLPGVSAFQLQFGSDEIFTAGDQPDVLIALNPAALQVHLKDLKVGGVLIVNRDTFNEKNLKRAGFETNPLEGNTFQEEYQVVDVALTDLTLKAVEEFGLSRKNAEKCKNFFALGIISRMYGQKTDRTLGWIEQKFKGKPEVIGANRAALNGGIAFAEASELSAFQQPMPAAKLPEGTYRNITGNHGLVLGLLAVSELSGLRLFYSGYPITPASDVLHELAKYRNRGVMTFQAEDEIAACASAVGASYAGSFAVTASSGPGILLKEEAIGLAVSTELPLLVLNVQRAGPSTGMPTKPEQSDLLSVLFGRNGESPVAVIAISGPEDAFETTLEAGRIALEHMTPVILMSDAYIANSSRPWIVPDVESLEKITARFTPTSDSYIPYQRDPETLSRTHAVPGIAGYEHRIGGLEKQEETGNVSYDPENHERMTRLRAEKIANIANNISPSQVDGPERGAVLVVGWGSTRGAIEGARKQLLKEGVEFSHLHLRHLNPFPKDLGEILSGYETVLVPEMNTGQLSLLLRAKFLKDIQSVSKVRGEPFTIEEIRRAVLEHVPAPQKTAAGESR